MITPELLLKIAPQAHDADEWAPALDIAAGMYGIDRGNRVNMWLAQLAHESAGFTRFEENLSYGIDGLMRVFKKYFPTRELAEQYARRPDRIANRVYAGRMGNGPESSGDGWAYRGRGPIQRTGKAGYKHDGEKLRVDLINFPDKLTEPEYGSQSAALYWFENRCNELADAGDFTSITRAINGGLTGIDDRKHWLSRVQRVMNAN